MDIITLLRNHEGVRHFSYLDSLGIPTVGCGLNMLRPDTQQRLTAVGADYHAVLNGTQGLTDDQIDTLLQQDVDACGRQLDGLVPGWRGWPENAQLVIQDLIFNMGLHSLSQFVNTLAAFKAQQWKSAAQHLMASKWYTQVGQRGVQDCQFLESI